MGYFFTNIRKELTQFIKDIKKWSEIEMKDEFKSEYINFEENKEITLEIKSNETKCEKYKKDKETGKQTDKKYFVYEFDVLNLADNSKGKISLFKAKVSQMYKILDEATKQDNKSLIGFTFKFKNIVTVIDGKNNYDLKIELVKPKVN